MGFGRNRQQRKKNAKRRKLWYIIIKFIDIRKNIMLTKEKQEIIEMNIKRLRKCSLKFFKWQKWKIKLKKSPRFEICWEEIDKKIKNGRKMARKRFSIHTTDIMETKKNENVCDKIIKEIIQETLQELKNMSFQIKRAYRIPAP